jgi:hypothetical protein
MYWDTMPLPHDIELCVDTFVRMNPKWKLKILTSKSRCPKPKGFANLNVQAKSDWYRVCYVARYGGLWLDISTIHFNPTESWLKVDVNALQGFRALGWEKKFMDSWAFGAPPANELVVAWRNEYRRAIEKGAETYGDRLPLKLIGSEIRENLPYFNIFAAFIIARRQHPHAPLRLISKLDRHPLFFQETAGYGADSVKKMLKAPHAVFACLPFVKITRLEREVLFRYSKEKKYAHSFFVRVLQGDVKDDEDSNTRRNCSRRKKKEGRR